MHIDLTKPLELPYKFIRTLSTIDALCVKLEFSEELVDLPKVKPLIKEICDYCHNKKVVGIHYTRATAKSIKEKGLLIRTGNEIRTDFLAEYSNKFTKEELHLIKETWKE